MNSDLQNLTPKVEDGGTTPQGRLTASEWNILLEAVKLLDRTSGEIDTLEVLRIVRDAGYATQDWVNELIAGISTPDGYVSIAGYQQITGVKNFLNGLKIGGAPITYDAATQSFFFEGNIVLSGGMAMRAALGALDVPTIMDALVVDGSNLKVVNGVLTFVGQTGGGGIDEDFLSNYLTDNRYTTQDWVLSQRYLTGISSSMITDALGYTPLSTRGGIIDSNEYVPLTIRNTNSPEVWVGFEDSTGTSYIGSSKGLPSIYLGTGINHEIIHSGNIRGYKAGGAIRADYANLADNADSSTVSKRFTLVYDGGATPTDLNTVLTGGGMIRDYYGGLSRHGGPAGAGFGAVIQFSSLDSNSLAGQLAWDIDYDGANSTKRLWWRASKNSKFTNSYWREVAFIDSDRFSPASGAFTVIGNILATGDITMRYTSDMRLKRNRESINASEILMSLGEVQSFEYVDSEVEKNHRYAGRHIGLMYQNVVGTALDRMCHEREDGFGSLNYIDTSYLALLGGVGREHELRLREQAVEIKDLRRENNELKRRIGRLERMV